MNKGRVKWFDAKKGFGFIEQDEGQDIFVHHSGIKMDGFKSLDEGDNVEFEIIKSEKGFAANNVIKITI